MYIFQFRRVVIVLLFIPLIHACEEREVLPFEDLYSDEIKALYQEFDPCESVSRNNFEINMVPIDEALQLRRRPYQILNISTGQKIYYLFSRHKRDNELRDEIILAIDSDDDQFRYFYHYASPEDNIGNYDFTSGSAFLQIFTVDKQRNRLDPRVIEIIYINQSSLFGGQNFQTAVNIIKLNTTDKRPDKSIFYHDGNRVLNNYSSNGSDLLGEQSSLICGEFDLFESCSLRQAPMRFSFSSLDNFGINEFLSEHIKTVGPQFFLLDELPDYYVSSIQPWVRAVKDEKIFEQIGCYFNSFETQSETDFQIDFD